MAYTIKAPSFEDMKSTKALFSIDPADIHEISDKRVDECITRSTDLKMLYAYAPIDVKHIKAFDKVVKEAKVFEKFEALLNGERVNTGEDRAVLHHLLRGNVLGKKIVVDGEDKEQFYSDERRKVFEFVSSVREGKILGSTGKKIKNVVQIGIGGSDLGPKAMSRALYSYALKNKVDIIEPYFISNVDPENAIYVMNKIDPEETLFILVSKSGTTLETLQNYKIVKALSEEKATPGFDFTKHLLAVTSKTSPLATSSDVLKSFFIDDYIGGRYSVTSAVGLLTISLSYGEQIASEFLKGAHDSDVDAYTQKSVSENRSLLDACIGMYYLDALQLPTLAVLPYSEALTYFVSHLQQLDMESNGKQDDMNGTFLSDDYLMGPIIWGASGTNGQHSFYQYLHQGIPFIPLEFIAFKHNSAIDENSKVASLLKDSQFKLNANVAAQEVAFAEGHLEMSGGDENHNHGEDCDCCEHELNEHKTFFGMRPSTMLFADSLTPYTLGLLLSHFENKVMFQGFIWNINSFDQEGVQLGKKLANSIIDGSTKNKNLIAVADLLK